MRVEIISSYNKMVWYAGMIGKTFKVAEIDKNSHVRIDNGKEINSCWVDKEDYKIINN
jgi:hypothetical protein